MLTLKVIWWCYKKCIPIIFHHLACTVVWHNQSLGAYDLSIMRLRPFSPIRNLANSFLNDAFFTTSAPLWRWVCQVQLSWQMLECLLILIGAASQLNRRSPAKRWRLRAVEQKTTARNHRRPTGGWVVKWPLRFLLVSLIDGDWNLSRTRCTFSPLLEQTFVSRSLDIVPSSRRSQRCFWANPTCCCWNKWCNRYETRFSFFPYTEVPLPLSHCDGTLLKTDKSVLTRLLEGRQEHLLGMKDLPLITATVIDGGNLLHETILHHSKSMTYGTMSKDLLTKVCSNPASGWCRFGKECII